jgi:hypothetical protein
MNNFIVNSIIVFAFSVLAFYGYTVYVLFYAWPVNEYDHGYWSNYQGHAKWSNLIKLEDIINKPPLRWFFCMYKSVHKFFAADSQRPTLKAFNFLIDCG